LQAWEKWRGQVTKLECSAFWIQCGHQKTRDGLKNLLHIMMGNIKDLTAATSHWLELFASHFLYIRPFTVVSLISMHSLAVLINTNVLWIILLVYVFAVNFLNTLVALLDAQCLCKNVADAVFPVTDGFTCFLLYEFPFIIAISAIPYPLYLYECPASLLSNDNL
jgi:hypothetical protein